jgi:hypothetical protein
LIKPPRGGFFNLKRSKKMTPEGFITPTPIKGIMGERPLFKGGSLEASRRVGNDTLGSTALRSIEESPKAATSNQSILEADIAAQRAQAENMTANVCEYGSPYFAD